MAFLNVAGEVTKSPPLKEAFPEVSPALYMGMSLGITFPLNIIFGIPLYTFIAQSIIK